MPNLSDFLRKSLQPSPNLINTESEKEGASTVLPQYSFYPGQQKTEEKIKRYNNVPQKYFINKNDFLYDKSNLIKETYITTLNKKYLYMVW